MKRTSKYVGLDVHLENTVISVRDDSTRVIARVIVATEAGALVGFLQQLRGSVHVALEEGTQADTLSLRLQRGDLRVVYHEVGTRSTLRELGRTYATVVKECTSQMLRLKAIFRARGIKTAGTAVYDATQRKQWLAQLTEPGARFRTQVLYALLDTAAPLRLQAKTRLIAEARRDPSYKRLRKVPGFGPIRAALVLALLLSPWRFRTKRNLWAFAGLAVVTHTSAEYTTHHGRPVRKARAPMTRGLNRNHHPLVKHLFKSAALAAIQHSAPVQALYAAYLAAGVRPEIARVNIARKLAAITLRIWKTGETFDATKLTTLAT